MANVRSRRSRMSTGSNTTMHRLSIVAARRGTIDPLKRARIHANLIRDYFRKTGAMPTYEDRRCK